MKRKMNYKITQNSLSRYLAVFLIGTAIAIGCSTSEKAESPDSPRPEISRSGSLENSIKQSDVSIKTVGTTSTVPNPISHQPTTANATKLPRMVDLGADKCVPCKAMAPILRDLKAEFKGKVNVEFIDVWKDPEPGKQYRIRVIPTQIFFDVQGKELFRHEGFYSREDIIAKWREFGFIKG